VDPTDAQSKRLKYLRDAFGKDVVKPHAPDPRTGIMRVSLTCMAGTQEWFFDRDAQLIDRTTVTTLFDTPPVPRKPRSAIDN
jgi:hypothetical protein